MRPGREHVTLLRLSGKEMVVNGMGEIRTEGCTCLRLREGGGLHGVAPEQGVRRRPSQSCSLSPNPRAPGPTRGRASLQCT